MTKQHMLRLVGAGAIATATACAPTLSTFTPAHVAKAGHVQAEVGSDVSIPTGTLSRLVDAGSRAAKAAQNGALTEQQERDVLDAAGSLLLNPPSMNVHLGVGVGIINNWEGSGRLVSGGWRLGTRYEFLHQDRHGIALSAGIGLGHYSWSLSVLESLNDLNGIAKYEEYSRWQFDLPLLVGKSGSWYRWWTGPKILLSTYNTSLTLSPNGTEPIGFKLSGLSSYLGALVGGAVGYKHVFFAAELTVVRFDTRAQFSASSGSNASNYDAKLAGLVVYPGLGLMGEF